MLAGNNPPAQLTLDLRAQLALDLRAQLALDLPNS